MTTGYINSDISIDPIILGHNQFFGVNHLSNTKGVERERRFNNIENVLELVRYAVQNGAGGLMLSTHPSAPRIIENISKYPELKDGLNFYPLLPYINKYIRSSNEKGIVNVVLDTVSGSGVVEKFKLMFSGGMGILKKDMLTLLKTLIDVEMSPFRESKVKAVFLHDVLTDLALGLDLKNIFELYIQHITENFGAIPAFATKNLPLLLSRFSSYNLKNPLLLVRINKAGFEMNPSRQICEEALQKNDVRVVAMGTLASGYLKPPEAYEYLYKLPKIESTVVGVSTKDHVKETFGIIKSHIK